MTPTDEQVERVARAIYETASGPWGHASYYGQEIVRREARAAIAAMGSAALQPQDCEHPTTFRGEDAPRRWGSDRTQVCATCGAYRRTNHHNRDLSDWLPAEQYAADVAPMDDAG